MWWYCRINWCFLSVLIGVSYHPSLNLRGMHTLNSIQVWGKVNVSALTPLLSLVSVAHASMYQDPKYNVGILIHSPYLVPIPSLNKKASIPSVTQPFLVHTTLLTRYEQTHTLTLTDTIRHCNSNMRELACTLIDDNDRWESLHDEDCYRIFSCSYFICLFSVLVPHELCWEKLCGPI